MVIEEGGEARTINLCKLCYNANKTWSAGQTNYGRSLEVNSFCLLRSRKILEDAGREKQEGRQSQWQQEPTFKEVLEQVKRSADTDCGPQTMRRAYIAMKHGNCESY